MNETEKTVRELGGNEQVVEKHESFGILGISRVSGGRSNLFGSSIKHQEKIVIRIGRAEKHRHLHRNWYHKTSTIVEVEMSPTQFAEAITSLNCGDGVPVTIQHVDGKTMKECPEVNQRQIFEDEFDRDVRDITSHMVKTENEIDEIIAKSKTGKSDLKRIKGLVERLHRDVRANIPFIQTQFNEAMDKTVLEAKGEVEATVLHAVVSAGLHAIADGHAKEVIARQFPQLTDGDSK